MSRPLVSVCIPARNAERTLRATLDSILRQDYPALDVVVSDNYSTDDTRTIIESYASRGIRYCTPPPRPGWAVGQPGFIGAYWNANSVLTQGRGELLCLYHADDVYAPCIVSKEAAFLQAYQEAGAVFTMARRVDAEGRAIRLGETHLPPELRGRSCFELPELLNALLEHSNFLITPSVMLRRAVLDQIGGFDEERFGTSADLDLWLRVLRRSSIGVLDEPLINYRITLTQGSASYNHLRTEPGDLFAAMDHSLAMPEISQNIRAQHLLVYEMYRASDNIVRAVNLAILGQMESARMLLESTCASAAFRAGLRNRTFSRQFVLADIFRLLLHLGLGSLAGWYYGRVYRPARLGRQMRPLACQHGRDRQRSAFPRVRRRPSE
ncbi:MAG: glycosyltransferase [Chloroflexi bacterium]|nr:glycosyltransferase [Chloroflexota bacterium]